MTRSILILNQGTNGQAQVTPSSYPTEVALTYEPNGQAQIYYGVNGQAPHIFLPPGTKTILIEENSLELKYEILKGEAKLEWKL